MFAIFPGESAAACRTSVVVEMFLSQRSSPESTASASVRVVWRTSAWASAFSVQPCSVPTSRTAYMHGYVIRFNRLVRHLTVVHPAGRPESRQGQARVPHPGPHLRIYFRSGRHPVCAALLSLFALQADSLLRQLVRVVCAGPYPLDHAHHRHRHLRVRDDDHIVRTPLCPRLKHALMPAATSPEQSAHPALPRRHLRLRRERACSSFRVPVAPGLRVPALRQPDVQQARARWGELPPCWACHRPRYPVPDLPVVLRREDARKQFAGPLKVCREENPLWGASVPIP